MKKLISEGASVNTKINVEGWGMKYPVNCALMHKDLDMVRLFIDNNACLNHSSELILWEGVNDEKELTG